MHTLGRAQRLATPPSRAFEFFADARNLEAITPPWLHFRLETTGEIEMREGALISYRLRLHGVPVRWLTRIEAWEPGVRFVDSQLRGPYALWHHTHSFEDDVEGGTVARDVVRYAIPYGPLGRFAHRAFVRRDLEAIFDFRSAAIARLLRDPSEQLVGRGPGVGGAVDEQRRRRGHPGADA